MSIPPAWAELRRMTPLYVLSQVNTISLGVDIPWAICDIDAHPSASEGEWLQRRGRVSRAWPPVEGDRSYQTRMLDELREALRRKQNPFGVGPCGCHRIGQKVLMYDGSTKPVEAIAVGDMLLGVDSTPRIVTNLCRGKGLMYRVIPIKGEPFVVNEDHVLTLSRYGAAGDGKMINISVKDYIATSKDFKWQHKLVRSTGIEFPTRQNHLPVDPYFLGVLIGDGHLGSSITITKQDPEIRQECVSQAKTWGLHCKTRIKGLKNETHRLVNGRGKKNRLILAIVALGLRWKLSTDKFIPDSYLTSSRSNRLELLAGLLDTDGHYSMGGYDFLSGSKKVSESVCFLSRSLGLAAYMKECQKSCQGGFTGTYWRVSINGDCSIIPCRIPRKKAEPRRQIKRVSRVGFSLEEIGVEDFYGFTLTGDGRYHLDDFTITHNSGKSHLTKLLAHSAYLKGKSVAVITVRRVLVFDLSDRFTAIGVPHSILMADVPDTGHRTRICSLDTLISRGITLDVDCIVWDEAHLMLSAARKAVVDRHRHIPQVFFSATPIRGDGLGMGRLADVMVHGPSTLDLIDLKFLVPSKVYAPELPDVSHVDINGDDFNQDQVASVMMKPGIVGNIVKHWLHRASGLPTVAHAVNRAHSELIVKRFMDAGVEALAIDAYTPDDEREEAFERLKLVAQPKTHAILLDFAGNSNRFGLSSDDRDWSLSDSEGASAKPRAAALAIRRCLSCWTVFKASTGRCPGCAHPFVPTQRDVIERREAMVEFKREQKAAAIGRFVANADDEKKVAKLAEYLKTAKAKSYRRGWAFGRYASLFGSPIPPEIISAAYRKLRV